MINKVRVYSPRTSQLTEIPADELAAGMVCVKMEGVGEVWVAKEELQLVQPGEVKHELDPSFRPYLLEIKTGLDEVYPQTLEKWEEGFRRDNDPEREISLWLYLARRYQKYISSRNLAQPERKDAFRVFLSCVNNGKQHALQAVQLEAMSKQVAQEAVEFFTRPE